VYSYGLMLAVAVIVCTFLLSRDARRQGIKSDLIFDFVFVTVVSGIIGARIFYVLLNFQYFYENPVEIVMIQNGGLAWQGGLILGSVFGLRVMKKNDLAIPAFLDLGAPYIALGQSIGRIGCFLNGCCYGREVSWGIFFPVHEAHLHPTQLYSTAGLFVVFLILKSYQNKVSHPGQVFVLYLILASVLRFVVEFFRADHYVTVLNLSIYQFVCLGILIAALYVHTRLKNQTRT